MPLSMLGTFADTYVFECTGAPQSFENTGPGPQAYVVLANLGNVLMRIMRNPTGKGGTSPDVVTANDLLVLQGEYARIRLDPGAVLSFMMPANEVAAEIRITKAGDNW